MQQILLRIVSVLHQVQIIRPDMNSVNNLNSSLGVVTSLAIITLWLTSLLVLLWINISDLTVFSGVCLIFLRTFLQTGLFITAHDAMHGAISPGNRYTNNLIGKIAIALYAFLDYGTLLNSHVMHHRYPASKSDPDFHGGEDQGLLFWYFKFMKGYLAPRQVGMMLTRFIILIALFKISLNVSTLNLITFWILPMVLSSFQLFYFGTFLPHRQPVQGYQDHHRAQSTTYSVFWSFITCYHFGYHWEHHEYPDLPWYKLPILRTEIPIALSESVGIITKLDTL
jgi:beta-carotene/zeaxanthin 4-ketolase